VIVVVLPLKISKQPKSRVVFRSRKFIVISREDVLLYSILYLSVSSQAGLVPVEDAMAIVEQCLKIRFCTVDVLFMTVTL
jgi:hypothetical protein